MVRSRERLAPGFDLSKNVPLVTRGWRAPGECRAVTPRKLGALDPSARRGDFLSSPGERYAPHWRGVQALRAAGHSADGPAGNAPRAGQANPVRGGAAPRSA